VKSRAGFFIAGSHIGDAMILFVFLWSTYAKISRGHLVDRCSERRRTHGGRRSAQAGMPARLGPWTLRAALPSVAAETPSSSPAAAPSAAASSVLEIAGEASPGPRARHSISGLPVKQIQAVNQHLSDQNTSITSRLVLSGMVETGRPLSLFRAINKSLSPAFRKRASIS